MIRFAKTYTRAQTAERKIFKLPSGEIFKGTTTVPMSIGEDFDEARSALLAFRPELPVLDEIDYTARGKKIAEALGDASQDEYEEEYGVALKDIKGIEEHLAAIGLRLAKEK